MSKACDEYEILISGYLDGELDAGAQRVLEEHVQECSACRREYESIKRLVIGTSKSCRVEDPPDVVWDTFLDTIYNRLERNTGWLITIFGVVVLTAYGVVLFYYEPWASALTKLLITVPVVGLGLLFVSVLRQRLRIARTDRYSREVHR